MSEAPTHSRLSRLRLEPHERRPSGGRRQVTLAIVLVLGTLIGAVAIAVLLSRQQELSQRQSQSSQQGSAIPVSFDARRSSSSNETIAAGGYIEARRSAQLQPGRDGVIHQVHVTLGQSVKQGELLLELENQTDVAEEQMAAAELALTEARLRAVRAGSRIEEVQAARSEATAAEARFEESHQNLLRLERLAPQGAVTTAEVDRARQQARAAEARLAALQARERMLRRGNLPTDVAAARAQQEQAAAALRRASARLELTRLRAPFAGAIVTLDVEPGEVISLQNPRPAIELADLHELWVRVDIAEARIGRIRLGASAEVVVDALGPERLRGEVVQISPIADRQSNSVEVAVRIIEPPALLRPNMSARVFIRDEERVENE